VHRDPENRRAIHTLLQWLEREHELSLTGSHIHNHLLDEGHLKPYLCHHVKVAQHHVVLGQHVIHSRTDIRVPHLHQIQLHLVPRAAWHGEAVLNVAKSSVGPPLRCVKNADVLRV
jgi:hypothetical protein